MSDKPKTIYLKDYQPPSYRIPNVDLFFELGEEKTYVTAQLDFVKNSDSNDHSGQLFLDGEALKLVEILRNGETLDSKLYEVSTEGLLLKDCPDQFRLQTKVELKPQDNKAFKGLYKTKTVFCTQMEAQGFRSTTFFMDRPDVLSKYRVSIQADEKKYPILLSNGNPVEEKQVSAGIKKVVWEDPFPKPCYLFALVAGDLDWIEDSYLTRSHRKVDLKIYVNKGKSERARFAMNCLKQSMKWDEDTFGLEYDLDIYNIVAVDDFNMGAMENKGLNIFNSKYVLASAESATDEEYQGIQSVIGHEYFHNWTGNRVTCRDWFQLSLKEGLTVFRDQEFSADLNSRPVHRISDVVALRSRQFPEDSGPMAHPVRPSSYIAIDNFYTVTVYEKGAEVIRMLHTLLGDSLFKKGVSKYFELYDGQAVTTDDWVYAMELVSGRDLKQFKLWYDQAGTPEVSVTSDYDPDQQRYKVTLRQNTLDPKTQQKNQNYHIPFKMGLLSEQGNAMDFALEDSEKNQREAILELTQEQQDFVFKNVYEKPVLSINREFSAPVNLNFEQNEDELYLLMTQDEDSFNRWESAQKLYRQTLLKIYQSKSANSKAEVPQKLLEAMGELVQKGRENPALTACLLSLPQPLYLAQFLQDIDPQVFEWAYKEFYRQASLFLQDSAKSVYLELESADLGQSQNDVALRSFKNQLLSFLYVDQDSQGSELFKKQFDQARNMTDGIAALKRLSQSDSQAYEEAKSTFLSKWSEDGLVLNKLFIVASISKAPKAFEKVKELMECKEFDSNNPNNLYSLVYSFGQHNWQHFHQEDGKAYQWFADQVIAVDRRNPQVASRMGNCFNQWKKFAEPYRSGMREAIQKILDSKPSDNLYEIVSRAVEQ